MLWWRKVWTRKRPLGRVEYLCWARNSPLLQDANAIGEILSGKGEGILVGGGRPFIILLLSSEEGFVLVMSAVIDDFAYRWRCISCVALPLLRSLTRKQWSGRPLSLTLHKVVLEAPSPSQIRYVVVAAGDRSVVSEPRSAVL